MPFYKGQKFSKQHRKRISEARRGRTPWNKGKRGIFKHSEETKNKIRIANTGNKYNLGKKWSEERKKKLSESQKGSKNHMWKADSVGYFALHNWVRKNWKSPRKCELCGTEDSYNYQWANLDGQYRRIREDWALLCGSCHKFHDNKRGKQKIFKQLNDKR